MTGLGKRSARRTPFGERSTAATASTASSSFARPYRVRLQPTISRLNRSIATRNQYHVEPTGSFVKPICQTWFGPVASTSRGGGRGLARSTRLAVIRWRSCIGFRAVHPSWHRASATSNDDDTRRRHSVDLDPVRDPRFGEQVRQL